MSVISGMSGCVTVIIKMGSGVSTQPCSSAVLPSAASVSPYKIQQHYNLHIYTIRYIYSAQHTVVDIFRSTAVDIYTIYSICSCPSIFMRVSDARWMQKQTKGEMVYRMVGPFIT